ncbi:type III-A CRISPR-associated RAMP protein Csm5 [Candidatus Kuenenia sp.]|uniref:type III-A CRISPR-associated RAMP protein Csm5 n=1 Tax=Candidatus Kuenenia sp. TaxID=2499824 RepID=UPI00322073CD
MKITKPVKFSVRTLTPVHIGNGNKYNGLSYLIDNDNNLIKIEIDFLFQHLTSEEHKKFVEWIESQSFQPSLNSFLDSIKRKDIIENLKDENRFSKVKVGKGFDKKEVKECINNSINSVFIPGSSIKGCLRTALAYSVISSDSNILPEFFSKELPSKPQNADEELMNTLFNCGVKKKDGEIDYRDSKYDLLKLLKVSDTQNLSYDQCIKIYPYNIFTKKKGGELLPKQKEDLYLETIQEDFKGFTVEISVDKNLLFEAHKLETLREWIGLNEKFEKIFGLKLSQVKRDNIQETENIIITKLSEATKSFSKSVIAYYKKLWDGQMQFFLHKNCNSAVGEDFKNPAKKYCERCRMGNLTKSDLNTISLKELQSKYSCLENIIKGQNDNFYLVLGFGSGFVGITLVELLNDNQIDRIREKYELGKNKYEIYCKNCNTAIQTLWETKANIWKTYNRIKRCPKCALSFSEKQNKNKKGKRIVDLLKPFPKTQRIAYKNSLPSMPFGWIELSLYE